MEKEIENIFKMLQYYKAVQPLPAFKDEFNNSLNAIENIKKGELSIVEKTQKIRKIIDEYLRFAKEHIIEAKYSNSRNCLDKIALDRFNDNLFSINFRINEEIIKKRIHMLCIKIEKLQIEDNLEKQKILSTLESERADYVLKKCVSHADNYSTYFCQIAFEKGITQEKLTEMFIEYIKDLEQRFNYILEDAKNKPLEEIPTKKGKK